MRTIKFRGLRCLAPKGWAYGSLRWRPNGGTFIEALDGSWCFPVEEETIGQYTGLNDKNGHEIYEGDIVDVDYILYDPWDDAEESLEPMRCVVVYEDFGFRFKKEEDLSYFLHDVKNIKVIGNIHDNPELLEGGNQ